MFSTSRFVMFSIFILVCSAVLLFIGVHGQGEKLAHTQKQIESVELGLAELSPRGELGGYAIPASGCGAAHGAHGALCPPPTISITARNITMNGGYTNGTLVFNPGDEVEIKWDSTQMSSCVAGPNTSDFSTGAGNPISGQDVDIIEPAAGSDTTLGISCTDLNGATHAASVVIRAAAGCALNTTPTSPVIGGSVGFSATFNNGETLAHLYACPGIFPDGGCWGGTLVEANTPVTGGVANFVYSIPTTVDFNYAYQAHGHAGAGVITTCNNVFSPTAAPPAPSVNVGISRNGDPVAWGPGPIQVGASDSLEVVWNVVSSDVPSLSCVGTDDFSEYGNPTPVTGAAAVSGQQAPLTMPVPNSTVRYGIDCTDSVGSGSGITFVDVQVPAPSTVTLDINTDATGLWTSDPAPNPWQPFVIGPLDNIGLRWSSTDATTCNGSVTRGPSDTSAGGFNTGGDPGAISPGTDMDISEPDIGTYATYRVDCSGLGGNSFREIEVQRPAPTPILTITNAATGELVTLVEEGTLVDVAWDTNFNDPAACRLTGPNLDIDPLPTSVGVQADYQIRGESDFTLDCDPNIISPTTGLPVNPGAVVTQTVNISSIFVEN